MNQRPLPLADPELQADHRRVAGLVLWLGPLPFGLAAAAAGVLFDAAPLAVLGLHLLIVSTVLWTTRRALGRRMRAAAQGEPTPIPRPHRLALLLGVLGVAALLGGPFLIAWVGEWASFVAELDLSSFALWVGWTSLGGALLLALYGEYYATTDRAVVPEARGIGHWLRSAAWMLFATAAVHLLLGYWKDFEHEWLGAVFVVVEGIVLVELLVRGALAQWTGYRPIPGAPAELFCLQLSCSRLDPITSVFSVLTDVFGIDLRGTWALTFIRRSLLPLALGLAAVGWLATAFVMVDTDEKGVLERFGKRVGEALEPGLHVVWPWPVDRVHRVAVDRIDSLSIGFVERLEDANMLWTRSHAAEEYNLLLGNGTDLVTVNAIVQYRVRDIHRFLYNCQNPVEQLQQIADRVLMRRTIDQTLDGVLSENLGVLAQEIEAGIQDAVDASDLGIEILDLTVLGLHPPVDVAEDYQAVVGAQIQAEMLVRRAEAYREEELPLAEARADEIQREARGYAIERSARAMGEAEAFEAELEQFLGAPELYRLRRLLEAYEQYLNGLDFWILDHRIERDGGSLWFVEEANGDD